MEEDFDFPKQMSAIWAPWRVEYFEQPRTGEGGDFLTAAAQAADDAAHLVVLRRKSVFLLMNRYPYSNGHLMAVPYRKAADLAELADNEKLELWSLAEDAQKLLRATVHAQGFNIGLNLGTCAGAGVPDHLHLHIVPRWAGDTNFMPVLGNTRVIPQGLEPLYERLVRARDELKL